MKVSIGSILRRLLAETVPVDVEVIEIDDKFIYTRPPRSNWTKEMGWKFLITSGYEVDEDLRWDGVTKSGSRIIGIVSGCSYT